MSEKAKMPDGTEVEVNETTGLPEPGYDPPEPIHPQNPDAEQVQGGTPKKEEK